MKRRRCSIVENLVEATLVQFGHDFFDDDQKHAIDCLFVGIRVRFGYSLPHYPHESGQELVHSGIAVIIIITVIDGIEYWDERVAELWGERVAEVSDSGGMKVVFGV